MITSEDEDRIMKRVCEVCVTRKECKGTTDSIFSDITKMKINQAETATNQKITNRLLLAVFTAVIGVLVTILIK